MNRLNTLAGAIVLYAVTAAVILSIVVDVCVEAWRRA
jgi:hypothetical protein